ncbi:type II secretion system inner membrane protein GspF [Leucothrix pacifica]|uniref:General secretion pathway protein F n=1 Tax=Leucothrix pacifica TaxID=1247513 RepID=A0A317CQB9_9GAMM|nr:type II secretion system inner membrane protein GspF [Leucothrix pacifica]PWQ98600.1 type II secretion system protein GspF [Leucothrix pacifica]
MPAFEYKALNAKGQEETGILEADTPKQIRQVLREGSLTPLSVERVEKRESGTDSLKTRRAGTVKPSDLALVTRQLATLVSSGSPLEEALAMTAKQSERRSLRHVMSTVRSRVMEGHSLASGLATFPSVFSSMYVATVAAGEQSGHLDAVLDRLADYTESRQEIQQKMSSALVYPVILVVVSIAIVAGLLVFIVPKIVRVFESMNKDIPPLTQFMINASDFLSAYGLYLLVGVILAFFLFRQLLKIDTWKFRWHKLLLKLPLIKKLVRSANTGRFARTLSILASSGVPILDAMSISSKVVENLPMRKAVEDAAIKVREGTPIHKALEQSGYFPPMTVYLIASGEKSGKLDDMLERSAVQQERETDTLVSSMLSLFEPILILVMGGVVLLIVMSIMLPILNMNDLGR